MELNFNLENLPFKISSQLLNILNEELQKTGEKPEQLDDIIFSFRDEDYSAELGGYHPVEIHLVNHKGLWCFDYITDFAFVGCGQDAELAKEIDFDFTSGIGFHLYSGDDDLKFLTELYKIWEGNFISYFESGVFKTKITANKY
ncbi:MAG: DUF2787 family protein [Methylococcales bacterium]